VKTVADIQRDLDALRASNKRQTKLAADLYPQQKNSSVGDVITATIEEQSALIHNLKSQLTAVSRKNDLLRSESREISELLEITGSHNDTLIAIRKLQDGIRRLEGDLSSHIKLLQGPGNASLKTCDHQIEQLHDILGTPSGGLDAILASTKSLVGQLNSQHERIDSLLNEDRLQKEQTARSKSRFDDEIIRLQQTLRIREECLSKIFRCFGTARSAEIVVQGIDDLRTQLNECHRELASYRMAQNLEGIFDRQMTNDRQFVDDIQLLLAQQMKLFKGIVTDIHDGIDKHRISRRDALGVLKVAETENQRLMDLLDPSIAKHKVHIVTPQSMHPFVRSDHELFAKKKHVRRNCTEAAQPGTLL
jgi:hypothetical protein